MSSRNNLLVYVYPPCSTCRMAVKWLKERGYTVDTVNIVEQPPTVEQLKTLIPSSGLDIRKWFNVSGLVYKELKLKDKLPGMNDEERMQMLSSNGMLIKRPIVTDGNKATIGYKPELYEEVWGTNTEQE